MLWTKVVWAWTTLFPWTDTPGKGVGWAGRKKTSHKSISVVYCLKLARSLVKIGFLFYLKRKPVYLLLPVTKKKKKKILVLFWTFVKFKVFWTLCDRHLLLWFLCMPSEIKKNTLIPVVLTFFSSYNFWFLCSCFALRFGYFQGLGIFVYDFFFPGFGHGSVSNLVICSAERKSKYLCIWLFSGFGPGLRTMKTLLQPIIHTLLRMVLIEVHLTNVLIKGTKKDLFFRPLM